MRIASATIKIIATRTTGERAPLATLSLESAAGAVSVGSDDPVTGGSVSGVTCAGGS